MGATCEKPQVDSDDVVVGDKDKLVKTELKRAQAKELFVVAGAEVVIIGSTGEEVPVRTGSLVLAKFEAPSQLAVLFVGESFEDQKGFYYPLLPETPVLLSAESVLTVHAGDGDVFAIRLQKPLPESGVQLPELVEALSAECQLQVQRPPDAADRVAGHLLAGGARLISGVEWATEHISKSIRRGGDAARSKIGRREEEVRIGEGTKAAVASVKFASGSAVVIASTVADGLLETALMIGQEVGKLGAATGGGTSEETAAVRVGKAAGVAGLQVFAALIRAGDRVAEEARGEAAAVVGHRYGKDSADVAMDGLGVAIDVKQVTDMFGKRAARTLAAKATLYTARGLVEGGIASAGKDDAKK